jgi:hypothetical protein
MVPEKVGLTRRRMIVSASDWLPTPKKARSSICKSAPIFNRKLPSLDLMVNPLVSAVTDLHLLFQILNLLISGLLRLERNRGEP